MPACASKNVRLVALGLALASPACANSCADRDGRPALVLASAAPSVASVASSTARERVTEHGETFEIARVSFALRDVRVEVADLGRSRDIGAALVRGPGTALLAVNGGFFGERGEPLGLVISGGRRLAPFSRTMSGGVLTIDGDRADLAETESFDAAAAHAFAVQCRPRLVVKGAVNIRADDGKRAERTALCLRQAGTVLEVVLARTADGGPSLLAFAQHLATAGCEDALNLDGGPSTGMAWRDDSGIHAEDPRGAIRHAIVVRRRDP
jgi:uncharacterized protein YigE (DUF2233 family)